MLPIPLDGGLYSLTLGEYSLNRGPNSPLFFAELTVPEPSTWAMMILGFASLGFAGYRVSRKAAAVIG